MKHKNMIGLYLSLLLLLGCSNDDTPAPDISPGNDPNFRIIRHDDPGLAAFNRKVVVFGVDIYAVPGVEDQRLLHAANLMAQYLDNDENGEVDDPQVLNAMMEAKAFMVMWKSESDLDDLNPPAGTEGQDLGNDETRPEWHSNPNGRFDAALEEVWHIISHAGYANAYPEAFGEGEGTLLTQAMDLARGGHFNAIPNPYPDNAWYSYDDETCDYHCQATEYFYWALTSMLGAQQHRLEEIGHEWKLNTREKVAQQDPAIFALITNENYHLPTRLPDGTYKR